MAYEFTIWERLFGRRRDARSQQTYYPVVTSSTRTGETITPEKALRNSTVFSCVNVIADNIAQLPWGVYDESNGQSNQVSYTDLDDVLRIPNAVNTPYEIKHATVVNMLTHGNAYWLVVRTDSGRVVTMTPLDPDKVKVGTNTAGRAVYTYKEGQETRNYRASSIVHFRDFSTHLVNGLSRVEQCADLIAQSNAIEYLSSDIFRNGSGVSGVISSEQAIPPDVQKKLIDAWHANFSQASKARGGLAVLGSGMEYTPFDPMKATDADLQNMKRLVIAQICGVFRVPTQYVELGDNNKYNNVSQKQTAFFRDTISPLVKSIEERLTMAFLSEPNLKVKFDVTDIQRGDRQTQMNIAVSGVSNGIITPNEAREYLEMNRIDDPAADMLGSANTTEEIIDVEQERASDDQEGV